MLERVPAANPGMRKSDFRLVRRHLKCRTPGKLVGSSLSQQLSGQLNRNTSSLTQRSVAVHSKPLPLLDQAAWPVGAHFGHLP